MRHRKRIHIPGGTYYTVRRCEPPHLIFERPTDYEAFEEHLALSIAASGAKLLGYCWMPDAIHLVLRVGRRPVADLVRRLTRYCTRTMQERSGVRIHPFSAGFPTVLIDPQAYLPRLLQYLHAVPVLAGMADAADDYPYTSQRAYLGATERVRVNTKDLKTLVQTSGPPMGVDELHELLATRPSSSTSTLFEQCRHVSPPILGDSQFVSRLPRKIRERFPPPDATPSLDEITAFVAKTHGVCPQELVSSRRQHELVVARARVAWFASEFGVASLTKTAQHLHRDASSLGRAVTYHQRTAPRLFTRDAFAELCASAQGLQSVSRTDRRPREIEECVQ